ncbi:Tautomerase/MIF superfamily [Podospora appendiculata]|uniref:L-dopachrome isomerase n=1 Tax=Podospora appendiculata TaxID=314037 RepID=A0AAE0XFI9_9PEZI|nr:Tautomerase/MIF superfamily [Podospora appendiculata]
MTRGCHPATANPGLVSRKTSVTATPANTSFAERKAKGEDAVTSHLVEGDRHMRNIDKPLPGDVVRRARKSSSKPDLTKRRSNLNFFEDVFSISDTNPAKERVRGDALVLAEVKTNVIISDEFTFITELSYHLSTRYQRPVTSIVVTLQHGACMLFGGNFDPAYVMSIFALPSQLLPATNKRNAALIQKHMEESIAVPPSRGWLRFVPTDEDQLAFNGKTTAGEIDELEKACGTAVATTAIDANSNVSSRKPKARKKLSVKSLASFRPPPTTSISSPELTPPSSANEALPPVPGSPNLISVTTHERSAGPEKPARRKKSFVASIFGRSAARPEYRPALSAALVEEG